MIHKDHKKLNLSNAKSTQKNLQKSKQKSMSKLEATRNKSITTLVKGSDYKNDFSTPLKTQKSKAKFENHLSLGKKEKGKAATVKRKRMISQLIMKQTHPKQANNQQKKQTRYIFNEIPNTRDQSSETMKLRIQTISSHNKCYSNQSLTKNQKKALNDAISTFAKSTNSDFTKIKKKKHDYIKSFTNKHATQEKSLSFGFSGFRNPGCSLNYTQGFKAFDKITLSQYPIGGEEPIIGQEVTDEQLENLQLNSDAMKLSQIRQNVSTLFKKLKSPCKTKLLVISSNYERIVSDLYSAIKKSSLPNCEISRIGSDDQKENEKENDDPVSKNTKSCQKSTNFNTPFHNKKISNQINCSADSSQHWDSYMNLNSQQYLQMNEMKNEKAKQNLVKKLDLKGISKPEIKQYQDEFMEMQDNFSESWKRQISQQTRF